MTRFDPLSLLVCPFCTGKLTRAIVLSEAEGEIDCGILNCGRCGFEYPVVAGIPIMMAAHEAIDSRFGTSQTALLDGPRVSDLVSLLKNGESLTAFAALLNPSQLGGDWFPSFDFAMSSEAPMSALRERVSHVAARASRAAKRAERVASRRLGRFVLPRARLRLAQFLREHQGELSALDAIDLYYRRYSGSEGFSYFGYRFGQPRFLAALTLLAPLLDATGPLLDLACGTGHLTHFLASAQAHRPVVGVDHDFFRVWLAKRYIAPKAMFVCAPADHPLPFEAGGFGGVVCSDAFHYFLNRAATVRDLKRLTERNGIVVLARIGNARVEPREGYELDPSGYAQLMGDFPHVLLAESELVEAYKRRTGPDLSKRAEPTQLDGEKWLSIVASHNPATFAPPKPAKEWLHAAGRLQLNPIYEIEARHPNGDLDLRFHFPSNWYKFENQSYLEYAPEACRIPADVLAALEAGRDHPALESFVSQFVVIGMPENYSRPRSAQRS
ncbi:MAG TPA: methyltransferase domain-containing protein [Polyangiaceae bacterium]|jgi:SAM-dependent methyltransferase/uncharacterized protein YbaR (Trm112 family)|nr:methyltransferase domain-containing protein [Polyangiaceae bacterium]